MCPNIRCDRNFMSSYRTNSPLNCSDVNSTPWLHSPHTTQAAGVQPKLFVKVASDDRVIGGSACRSILLQSTIPTMLRQSTCSSAGEGQYRDAIFGNYYLHNAPH